MTRLMPTLPLRATALLLMVLSADSFGTTLTVADPTGQPLALVMVRERPAAGPNLDTSDNGYPAPGVARTVAPELTRFSDAAGRVEFADRDAPMEYLVRRPSYRISQSSRPSSPASWPSRWCPRPTRSSWPKRGLPVPGSARSISATATPSCISRRNARSATSRAMPSSASNARRRSGARSSPG